MRNLEREIGNVCRKIARTVVNAQSGAQAVRLPPRLATGSDHAATRFQRLLGPQKFRDQQADKKNEVGATVGLAWTEVGGSILTTEAPIMEGRGKLTTTGKLGDVMQESAQAAMSYVRSAGPPAWDCRAIFIATGYSPARARGRDSEGRTVGRHHHRHQHLQRADQHSGARRSRHDRRDHGARARAAHRRLEGKSCWRRIGREFAK